MNKDEYKCPTPPITKEISNTEPYKRRPSKKRVSNTQNVGMKLAMRKYLFQRRKFVCDLCVLASMVGVICMIADTELTIFKIKERRVEISVVYVALKWIVSLSTVLLLGFLVWFHQVDIRIFMIDNGMEDWRLAITLSRVLLIFLEVIVCAIHPIPGDIRFRFTTFVKSETKSDFLKMQERVVSIDVILSLPMFLRFFLVCRALMLHSHIYQDASAQSLGALNRIQFNFAFIFKSLMNLYAEYVLAIMITFLFLWASWGVRACESYNGNNRMDYLDSMWLIAITFLTVGYGDIIPSSTCGKAIAVMTGIFGVGCTALVVAILSRKLEFSRSEMYVHNFVISVELSKQMKHVAANVVKEGWLAHKYRKLNMQQRALKHERRLIQAIRRIREIKVDQSRLTDNNLTLVELNRTQNSMDKTVQETHILVQQIHDTLLNTRENI